MRSFALLVGILATLATASGLDAQIVVVSSLVHEQEAGAGESYTGQIRLRNNGTETREARAYQTDYLFHADGRTLYDPPGSHGRSNAAWLRITPTTVTIPAGETAEISFAVAVPDTSQLSGTYWSMIMVEQVDPPRPDDRAGPGVGLRTVVRFGVQVATHVPGAAAHRVAIREPRVVVDSAGARSLEFVIVNEGDVGYRPKVSLEVYNTSGGVALAAEKPAGLMYPGTSAVQRFELKSLAAGTYEALVAVDTGSMEVFGAQFNLTIAPDR